LTELKLSKANAKAQSFIDRRIEDSNRIMETKETLTLVSEREKINQQIENEQRNRIARERDSEEKKALRAVIESKAKPVSKNLPRAETGVSDGFTQLENKFGARQELP